MRQVDAGFVQFVNCEQAQTSEDEMARAMSRALKLAVALVSANGGSFFSVLPRRARLAAGPVLFTTGHGRRVDPEERYREYALRYHAVDPFDPARHEGRRDPIVSPDDLGGQQEFGRSQWAAEYLAEWGVDKQLTMFIRDRAGVIVAGMSLTRSGAQSEFSAEELAVLRALQPLVEHAYELCRRPGPLLEHADLLHRARLSAAEISIARRCAAGASDEEIAKALMISRRAVDVAVERILQRLGLRDRRELGRLLGPDAG
jgi:DNA-binding CsgD family transcriptional regulator